jgi:hypothetical protein
MSDNEPKPSSPAAPGQESLRAEFGGEFDPEPEYGEARLWAVARDPHCIFCYWQFRPTEHPDAVDGEGVARFHIRILREDQSEETTVEIEPAAGNWFIPVDRADSSYFAELGFFANDVWCFIARSRATRTPPEAMGEYGPRTFATIPARLSLRRLAEILASSAIEGEGVAQTAARIQAAAQTEGAWTAEQEELLVRILAEEMEKIPLSPGSSVSLAQRIRRRLAAAEEAAGPGGPVPPMPGEVPSSPGSEWPTSAGGSWAKAPGASWKKAPGQ